jgi:predicted enzyme related to lactoylglutathione lyase
MHPVVWFDIPTENMERAQKFYGKLFGWKFDQMPGMEYWHMHLGGKTGLTDGGMGKRQNPQHGITTYVGVPSVSRFITKLKKLGGKVCMPKTAVPGHGYFAVCLDTENNAFALWEPNKKAK